MTLFRQLFWGTSLLFFVVLVGIEAFYLNTGRESLERQLAGTAQDAATSIALSLGARGRIDDPALVEVTLAPVFDRGYYSSMAVTTVTGEIRASRKLDLARPEVPDWFARLLPIRSPTAEAIISAGWQQLGRVSVTTHPHFIYEQLWTTAQETLAWLLLAYAAALVALRLFLRTILKPLAAVESAARAIAERQFPQITTRAGSVELQRVISSVNSLSGKIRTFIEEESAQAKRLQQHARTDAVTGIYTREAFEQAYANLGMEEGDVYSMLIGVWQIDDLKTINAVHGRVRADAVLVVCADALRSACAGRASLYARLSGSEFVVAGINLSESEAEALMAAVSAEMTRRLTALFFDAEARAVGGGCYRAEAPFAFSEMLGAADLALARARLGSARSFELITEAGRASRPQGSGEWRVLIENALAAGRFVLYGQRVFALPDRSVLHTEVFSRLLDVDGGEIEARAFIPMMSRHRLLPAFDAAVVRAVIAHVRAAGRAGDYAVNVSAQTLEDEARTAEVLAALKAAPDVAGRLTFEMTEFGVAADPDVVARFAAALRVRGAHFAIDHFSLDRTVLAKLPVLLPRYLKLATELTLASGQDDGSAFLLATLKRLARPLEIQLIAQAGDDAGAAARLEGLAGFQSYAADLPQALAR